MSIQYSTAYKLALTHEMNFAGSQHQYSNLASCTPCCAINVAQLNITNTQIEKKRMRETNQALIHTKIEV